MLTSRPDPSQAYATFDGPAWATSRWGCIGRGGRYPPSRAPSLCPATVPLTASAGFQASVTDSNRPQPLRQPPPTACLSASGAASEVPSLLMHPCLKATFSTGLEERGPYGLCHGGRIAAKHPLLHGLERGPGRGSHPRPSVAHPVEALAGPVLRGRGRSSSYFPLA